MGAPAVLGPPPHLCPPQLCAEDVKDFLEHMAVVHINRGWEFILPCDSEFVRKHPDVVQRQHMLWTGIQAKYEAADGAGGSGAPSPAWGDAVRRQRMGDTV